MPGRHHPYAPKFDGTPTLLDIFFDDVEQLAKACNISGADKIAWTIRYAPIEDRELWEFYRKGYTWQNFKAEIRTYYPGSDRARLYSLDNLKSLTESYASKPMETTDNFGKYYRAFCKIAYFLKSKDRISDRETSTYFIQGFHPHFRRKVLAQLRAESPTHHPDDPYKVSRTYSAALFILSCDQNVAEDYSEQASEHIKSIPEQSNSETLQAMMVILAAEVSKIINAPTSQQPAHQGAYLFPAPQHQISLQPRTSRCVFCSELSHHLRDCPRADDYVKSGRCKRNSEGRVILPNGNTIERHAHHGRNLKERIDHWHAENYAPLNSVNYSGENTLKISADSVNEEDDIYLSTHFQYSWLKDDHMDKEKPVEEASTKQESSIDPEIFQSFAISQLEEVKVANYTSKRDDERNSTTEPIIDYPATSVDAQMITTPTVNPGASKIDAQIFSELTASVSVTRPTSHILTRSTIEDMCAARRLSAAGNTDHPPKVRNSELENVVHNMALGYSKATASTSAITQLRTREEHTHAMSSLRDPGDLSDEMTQRRRALADNCTAPHARVSPIEAGAQEKSPAKIVQRNLEDHKPGLVVRVPTDMQQSELYPREWKRDATVPRQRTGYAQNHENGRTDCLHLKSPAVQAVNRLSTAGNDKCTLKSRHPNIKNIYHTLASTAEGKKQTAVNSIASRPRTHESPAAHISSNMAENTFNPRGEITQRLEAPVEDGEVSRWACI